MAQNMFWCTPWSILAHRNVFCALKGMWWRISGHPKTVRGAKTRFPYVCLKSEIRSNWKVIPKFKAKVLKCFDIYSVAKHCSKYVLVHVMEQPSTSECVLCVQRHVVANIWASENRPGPQTPFSLCLSEVGKSVERKSDLQIWGEVLEMFLYCLIHISRKGN